MNVLLGLLAASGAVTLISLGGVSARGDPLSRRRGHSPDKSSQPDRGRSPKKAGRQPRVACQERLPTLGGRRLILPACGATFIDAFLRHWWERLT
jgi:hypothetical protein